MSRSMSRCLALPGVAALTGELGMFAILEEHADGRRNWVARRRPRWQVPHHVVPERYAADPDGDRSNAERDAALFRMGVHQRRTTHTVVEVEKVDEWREAVDQEEGYPVLARRDARSAHR